MRGAALIHVFNERARRAIVTEAPELAARIRLIGQAVEGLPVEGAYPQLEMTPATRICLLPVAIRPVKDVLGAINLVKALRVHKPEAMLWVAGQVLDEEYGLQVLAEVAANQGTVRYLGEVAHGAMGGLFRRASLMLNTSESEGQSSAILEAMAVGVPVLARANDGNRDVITHGVTGLLYSSEKEFVSAATALIEDEPLRKQLAENAKIFVARLHASAHETRDLLAMYSAARALR